MSHKQVVSIFIFFQDARERERERETGRRMKQSDSLAQSYSSKLGKA